jgi:glycoside/pentoside/hexuronide:cation symporter, GPH family
MQPATSKPLSARERTVYGLGALALGIPGPMAAFYLQPFYTDVLLVAPWLVGLVRMLGLVWDGVNDPIAGALVDRTRTRFGRRRPFLLGAAIPMALSFALLWSPPAAVGPLVTAFYLLFVLCVADSFSTLYGTSYAALGAELSTDVHERTRIAVTRVFGEMSGMFLGAAVAGVLVDRAADPAAGHALAGLAIAALVASAGLVSGYAVSEPQGAAEPTRLEKPFRQDLVEGVAETLRSRPFAALLASFGLYLVGSQLQQAVVPYAFRYWLKMPDRLPLAVGVYLVAAAVSLPLWTRMARIAGKGRAFELCILWEAAVFAVLPLVMTPGMSLLGFGGVVFLLGLNGGRDALAYSIVADLIDAGGAGSVRPGAGIHFGVWDLTAKIAIGTGYALAGIGLDAIGYAPNAEQPPSTLVGIALLFGPVPALFLVGALVVFRWFGSAEIDARAAARS